MSAFCYFSRTGSYRYFRVNVFAKVLSFCYRYLVMPLMQMDLYALLFDEDRNALSDDQIKYITYQILRGLQVLS